MADIMQRYMTIDVIVMVGGMDFSCWMSTEDFWRSELMRYPHLYTYMGDRCTWFMHSNIQLTPKIITMAGEQADKICADIVAINAHRKLDNR